jgi:hypothetical protein
MKLALSVASLTLAIALAACNDGAGVQNPSALFASVSGAVETVYVGTGSFQTRPASVPGPRFTLHSTGKEGSANQGFAFHAMDAPGVGEMDIGALSATSAHGNYWYDEDGVRMLFVAESGTLRITESTARQLRGWFEIQASLLYVCEIVWGFPGDFIHCEDADEEAALEITGSFQARPIGAGAR